jgi:hypothetical protein
MPTCGAYCRRIGPLFLSSGALEISYKKMYVANLLEKKIEEETMHRLFFFF